MILEAKDLTRVYVQGGESIRAVDNCHLTVNEGDFITVTGPSGCGKSTLLGLLGGIDRPDGGKVYLDGESLYDASGDRLSDIRAQKIGFVFQNFSLLPTLSAEENIRLPCLISGRDFSKYYFDDLCDMLGITRRQIMDFLKEYGIPHVEDSSNAGDDFLRNRIRHHVMPLLAAENPRLAENLSATAQRLREDAQQLRQDARYEALPDVQTLRQRSPSIRSRMLEQFLTENGVKEPSAEHIALAEALVFSDNPSARGVFPGGVIITRQYDRLAADQNTVPLETVHLPESGTLELPGFRVTCAPATALLNTTDTFTVNPAGGLLLRSRQSGDAISLSGGSRSLKKLFIDRKIPAAMRQRIPVICDERGILGIYGIGADIRRKAVALPAITIHIETL